MHVCMDYATRRNCYRYQHIRPDPKALCWQIRWMSFRIDQLLDMRKREWGGENILGAQSTSGGELAVNNMICCKSSGSLCITSSGTSESNATVRVRVGLGLKKATGTKVTKGSGRVRDMTSWRHGCAATGRDIKSTAVHAPQRGR